MTAPRPLPSQERLRALFDYDEYTGYLVWRCRDDIDPGFNGRFAGKRAGGLSDRYWRVTVDHRNLTYHRVIWKWVHGTEPPEIDHVNGDTSDNRLVNLRGASRFLNAKNRGANKGKLLPKGVRLRPGCKNYMAYIRTNGINSVIGYFPTVDEAHEAYLAEARIRFGEWMRADITGGAS